MDWNATGMNDNDSCGEAEQDKFRLQRSMIPTKENPPPQMDAWLNIFCVSDLKYCAVYGLRYEILPI